MANVFPESMNRLDYGDVNGSLKTMADYINYICERVDYTYGQLFKDITGSGVLSIPIAMAVSELQKDLKVVASQVAGAAGEATSALNKANRALEEIGDDNSGIVKDINDINTEIGSDEAGHESGILGDIKAINTAIGSDEAGHESGMKGDIKSLIIAIGSDEAGHESGILGELKAINTAIGSDEAGHESGILGDIKEIYTIIGSDEAGQESGVLGELKDHEARITALEQ